MNERIQTLVRKMKIFNIEAGLLTNPISIMYYTYSTFKKGSLLVSPVGAYLFVNYNELVYAKEHIHCDIEVLEAKNYPDIIKDIIGEACLCCEKHYISEYEFNYLANRVNVREDYAIDFLVENQRSIKDADEIKKLTLAQDITEKSFDQLITRIQPGMTEKEVAHLLKRIMMDNGSDGESFDTTVSSGRNTRCPHWIPTDKKIERGDLIMIDAGSTIDGYHSDMTRMISIGEPLKEVKSLYTHVYNLFRTILMCSKDGASIETIYDKYMNYINVNIEDPTYVAYFNAGHGVGLDIHETPSLSPTYRKFYSLEEDMVLAIEPAIYTDTFGIRIENMVLITSDSYKVINKSNYDNIIII